jgi:hypothetical protein
MSGGDVILLEDRITILRLEGRRLRPASFFDVMGGMKTGASLSQKLALCGLLILSGCASHHAQGEAAIEDKEPPAVTQNNEAIDRCQKLYPDPHRKPALPRVKCFNDATLAYYTAFAGNPWSAQVRAFTATMASIAEKHDTGRISNEEFDFQKEQAIANYTSQVVQATQAVSMTVLPKQMTCVPTTNGVSCY